MYKSVLLALFGLVAVASAAENRIELGIKNYLKLSTPLSFLKTYTSSRLSAPGDPTVWADCDADGGFKIDMTQTYNKPEPPTKGSNVELIFGGVFTQDVALGGINVYVTWNDTPLYVNFFNRSKDAHAGDAYTDDITWLVPSFAPSGHYHVELTVQDKGKTTKLACKTVDFDL